MAADNKTLGRFILDGIPPAPRGVPQIEVTFDIDANGVLNVKAIDKATGKEQHITITASTGLSEEEIERMKKEAEEHAEEDRKKKELVEARNLAESLISTSEKTLKEAGDKIGADVKKAVEEKIEALKKVKDGEDKEAIKKATDELSAEIQKIGQAMYSASAEAAADKQAKASDNQQKQTENQAENEDKKEPKEAEFEEVKDEDKKDDSQK